MDKILLLYYVSASLAVLAVGAMVYAFFSQPLKERREQIEDLKSQQISNSTQALISLLMGSVGMVNWYFSLSNIHLIFGLGFLILGLMSFLKSRNDKDI